MDHEGLEVSLCLGFQCWFRKVQAFHLFPVSQGSRCFRHQLALAFSPPSTLGLHTSHCRLPGTSSQMCTLICDYTLPLQGRTPTKSPCLPLLPVFQQINTPKEKTCCWLSASFFDDSALSLKEWTNICPVTDHWLYCFDLVPPLHFLLRGTTINSEWVLLLSALP